MRPFIALAVLVVGGYYVWDWSQNSSDHVMIQTVYAFVLIDALVGIVRDILPKEAT